MAGRANGCAGATRSGPAREGIPGDHCRETGAPVRACAGGTRLSDHRPPPAPSQPATGNAVSGHDTKSGYCPDLSGLAGYGAASRAVVGGQLVIISSDAGPGKGRLLSWRRQWSTFPGFFLSLLFPSYQITFYIVLHKWCALLFLLGFFPGIRGVVNSRYFSTFVLTI